MNITVRGLQNEVSCKQFNPESQAADLFNQIATENGLELGSFKIIFEGNEICDALTLAQNGLVDGCIVDLGLEVDGGKKKKKKKVYKTEKKKKHKHINTKLRILSYYNIKSDGTVEPTKVKSPASNDTNVLYMANHWNRHYCGRTNVTLIKEKPDPIKKKVVAKVADVKADAGKGKAAPAKGAVKGKKK